MQLRHFTAALLTPALAAACQDTLESPPPSLFDASPGLVCGEQLTTTIQVEGAGLAPAPTGAMTEDRGVQLPELWLSQVASPVGEAAEEVRIDPPGLVWRSQSSLAFDLDPTLAAPAGVYDVHAKAADGRATRLPAGLTVVSAPAFSDAGPALACLDDDRHTLVLDGTSFLVVDGELPTVSFGDEVIAPIAARGCTGLLGPVEAESCTRLEVEVGAGALAADLHEVTVTNPGDASCATTAPVAFEVVSAPLLDAAAPALACADQQDTVLSISGQGFIVLDDGTLPTVRVGDLPLVADAADGCVPLSGPEGGSACDSLTVTVPAGAAAPGRTTVTVFNPEPASCATPTPVEVELVGPPEVSSILPEPQCTEQSDHTWTIQGAGFVALADGTLPTVSVGGIPFEADGLDGCADLLGPEGGASCTALTFTTADGALEPGLHDVVVTNPDDTGCSSTATLTIEAVAPPTLTSVRHELTCDAQSDTVFTLTGEGFLVTRTGVRPTVTLGSYVAEADAATDCTERAGPSGGSVCTTLSIALPEDAVGAGVHGVTVTNPGDAACDSAEVVEIEVVGAPVLDSLDTPLACDAEGDVPVLLSGTGFIVLADGTLPAVTIGGASAVVDGATDCAALAGPAGGESCARLAVTLPQGAAGAGLHDVVVVNPEAAACQTEDAVAMEVLGEPTLASTDPALTCGDAGDTTLTLTGSGFLIAPDGSLPSVSVGAAAAVADSAAGCVPLAGAAGGELCTTLTVTIAGSDLADGTNAIRVDNPAPASCDSEEVVTLTSVGAPVVDAVGDALACDEQFDAALSLSGSGFVVAPDGALPTVTVDGTPVVADAASGCAPLPGSGGGQTCTGLDFTLPAGTASAGVVSVGVTNPAPVDCSSTTGADLQLVSAPVVVDIDPELTCGAQSDVALTLTGADFLVAPDGTRPTVEVDGWSATADSASGCVSLTGPDGGESCTTLVVTLPAGTVADGVQEVRVTNPSPAACTASGSVESEFVPPPSVASASPSYVCTGTGSATVSLAGAGFVVLADGTQPTVYLDADPYSPDALSGCSNLTGPAGGQTCTDLDFTLATGTMAIGEYALAVENPTDTACESVESIVFSVAAPPTITGIDPAGTCPTGGTITVTGTGFTPGTTVTLDAIPAAGVTFVSSTTLDVLVPAGLTPNTTYSVTVENPGCGSDTLANALLVSSVPSVFYLDPPVTYTGIQLEGTAYISAVDTVTDVWIEEAATGLQTTLSFSHATGDNQVGVTIPNGLTEGSYTLGIANAYGCTADLPDAFYAEDDLTVGLDEVDPEQGWTNADTAVTVTGTGFVDVPRLYLNPNNGSTASGLSSVRFRSTSELNAVIPSGLDVDTYDVIVINPDGTIGLLASAFEVTAEPTPFVDAVAPASVSTSDGSISITGEDFRSPTVAIDCVAASNGAQTTASATVSSSTATTIEATIPSSSYSNGDVCLVVVTNSDGTYFEYSAISITSPSYNLYGFTATSSMTTGRRAPAVFAGRATNAERYLYAAGGDAGTAAGANDSVEAAPLDRFGNMGTWRELEESALPQPTTLAGVATIGRFVYLVGGHDDVAPVAEVYRAQVLDPQESPRFAGLEMDYGDGTTGMTDGTWIYRVSALYPSGYDANPAGESLASDPIVINVPAVPDLIELTIEWEAVDNASGYRIYRSPTVGAGSGVEEWLDDVSGGANLTYTDLGGATDSSVVPLEDGSLGAWKQLPSLSVARQGPGVTVGTDPTDPNQRYLYAAGGLDSVGTALDDIEYIGIYEDSEQEQSFDAAWTASSNVLDAARSELGAWTVEDGLNPSVPAGESWIYFGGGNPTGNTTKTTQAGLVTAGGELGSWTLTVSMNKARAGFGVAVASDQLYAFGGHNGSPNSSSDSTSLDAAGPPTLSGWNAGAALVEGRYLLGSSQESAHIYLVGGETAGKGASQTVEYGPW